MTVSAGLGAGLVPTKVREKRREPGVLHSEAAALKSINQVLLGHQTISVDINSFEYTLACLPAAWVMWVGVELWCAHMLCHSWC